MHAKPAGVAVAALLVVAACTSAPPTVADIPDSIATASTPAEHRRIADHFAQKAHSYDAEAAEHEKVVLAYANRPRGDVPAIAAHCRALREHFENAAKDARALEQVHRQLAGGATR